MVCIVHDLTDRQTDRQTDSKVNCALFASYELGAFKIKYRIRDE